MVFPILGANTESAAYEIQNSLRFNTADDAFIQRTFTAGTRTKFTISCWVKRGNLSGKPNDDPHRIIDAFKDANNVSNFFFETDDTLRFFHKSAGTTYANVVTNRVFRDPSAWYHLVCAVDTTQSTESNRIKFYVNGVQETSFSTYSVLENLATFFNDNTRICTVGAKDSSSGEKDHFDGYMADFYYVDNQQYDQTYFGKTNDNGVWIPVEKGKGAGGDLTFGTNGFFLEFQQTGTSANSSGMGADTSGNDLHLTPNNLAATDVTTDTPTNNFATVNRLTETQGVIDFSEGNTEIAGNTTTQGSARSSIQIPPSGKWYIESEFDAIGGSGSNAFGIVTESYTSHSIDASGGRGVKASYSSGASSRVIQIMNGSSQIGSNINVSAGIIMQLAIDQDNGKAWLGKDDTYYNSSGGTDGNPSTGSNPTFTFTAENFDVLFGVYKGGGGDGIQRQKVNFGNPAFSISSGNADANGYGNFEYAVPSGFYSLCTKNLAEFG